MPPVGPARRARPRRGGRPPSRSRRTTCAAPPLSSRHELPGAHKPYTAVLEARPSIRGGTQDSGRGRTISRKRSRRWKPTAFPRRSHPASSALALPSLTYKGADLREAHLEWADLHEAHLEGAGLDMAHLEGANLYQAHLVGKVYAPDDPDLARIRYWTSDFPATLSPADLSSAFFDSATYLNEAVLAAAERGAVRVADVRWGGVNLAVVADWTPFTEHNLRLGDEQAAWTWRPAPFTETA